MNMFAMGHSLHSAVRQEVRKFLYNPHPGVIVTLS